MALPIRVFQLIAALESLEEAADSVDAKADDGVGNGYAAHLSWTIEFLKDKEVFDQMDPIISFE
jgi:hypothetical protein